MQLAGFPVEHIEKTVLRRLHDDFALAPVDLELGQNHVLDGGKIPGVTRYGLVVPHVIPGIGIKRDD